MFGSDHTTRAATNRETCGKYRRGKLGAGYWLSCTFTRFEVKCMEGKENP